MQDRSQAGLSRWGVAAAIAAGGAGAVALASWLGARLSGPANSMIEAEERRYAWRHGEVTYKVKGRGAPVVLIHGIYAGASSFEYRRVFDLLARDFRVYAVDLLGFGQSQRPPLVYTPTLYETLILDFLTQVVGAADHPAFVVASSLSAAFTIRAAAERPSLFSRLVLIEPTGIESRTGPVVAARAASAAGGPALAYRRAGVLPIAHLARGTPLLSAPRLRRPQCGHAEAGQDLLRADAQARRALPRRQLHLRRARCPCARPLWPAQDADPAGLGSSMRASRRWNRRAPSARPIHAPRRASTTAAICPRRKRRLSSPATLRRGCSRPYAHGADRRYLPDIAPSRYAKTAAAPAISVSCSQYTRWQARSASPKRAITASLSPAYNRSRAGWTEAESQQVWTAKG